jgi:hypothetical protein
MIVKNAQLVTNTVLKNYRDKEESIRYNMVIDMIKSMPVELLNEVFNIKILDPDATENIEIIKENKITNLEYIKKLLKLKDMDCVQYECSFDVDEFLKFKK